MEENKEYGMYFMRTITIVFVISTIFCLISSVFGMPLRKAPADKIAVSYGGGIFEGAQYQGSTNPGSGIKFNGFFDKWYEYPTTQRNYIASLDADGDKGIADAISAPDKNGVSERVEVTVTFKLNTSKIRKFHETIGLKYKAWESKGWDKMLDQNLRQPLNNAIQQKIREFTTEEIRTDTKVLPAVQEAVEKSLQENVKRLIGDDYFCGPEYKFNSKDCPNFQVAIKAITPPKSVISSYNDQKVSENKVIVAKNEALAQIEKAKGEQAAKDAVAPALTPEYLSYLRVQALQTCASKGNCSLIVGGNEFNVNVR